MFAFTTLSTQRHITKLLEGWFSRWETSREGWKTLRDTLLFYLRVRLCRSGIARNDSDEGKRLPDQESLLSYHSVTREIMSLDHLRSQHPIVPIPRLAHLKKEIPRYELYPVSGGILPRQSDSSVPSVWCHINIFIICALNIDVNSAFDHLFWYPEPVGRLLKIHGQTLRKGNLTAKHVSLISALIAEEKPFEKWPY